MCRESISRNVKRRLSRRRRQLSIMISIFRLSSFEVFAKPNPGRSTRNQDSLMRKWLISRVFPGVPETFARVLLPVIILINDDFPTFDRPMNANSGRSVSGQSFNEGLLAMKFAEEIFIER